MKNERLERQRDLSVELNHANAEYFNNSFKGMDLKQNNNKNNNIAILKILKKVIQIISKLIILYMHKKIKL